jgi:thymidylate synthase
MLNGEGNCVSKVIVGNNVSEAWLKASHYLDLVGGGSYNLIVEVLNPLDEDAGIRTAVNKMLRRYSPVETVASTIFPKGLWDVTAPREVFYKRFNNCYPSIRQIKSNNTGTYFGRLVNWKYEHPEIKQNQLENTIQNIKMRSRLPSSSEDTYEMTVYDPLQDYHKRMGFPCMSCISIGLEENKLNMTAIYRNQYFIRKGYGNYLGLGRLLHFISVQTGYDLGILTCIATHAELENGHKNLMNQIYKISAPGLLSS